MTYFLTASVSLFKTLYCGSILIEHKNTVGHIIHYVIVLLKLVLSFWWICSFNIIATVVAEKVGGVTVKMYFLEYILFYHLAIHWIIYPVGTDTSSAMDYITRQIIHIGIYTCWVFLNSCRTLGESVRIWKQSNVILYRQFRILISEDRWHVCEEM